MSAAPLQYLATDLPLFKGATIEPAQYGKTFDPVHDGPRLTRLYDRVFAAMSDHQWWTLRQLVERCGNSEGGCHARVREMRWAERGAHEVESERISAGLWRYRLVR